MRPVSVMSAAALVALFSACNAILGNESDYELVGSGGDSAEAGSGGTKSAGAGGKSGSAGRGGGAGSGGTNTGKGGSASPSGGSAGEGTAASGGSDDGAAGDSAGAGGEAGAPSCVSMGPENCFNRIDDDCNGDIDCEDAACVGPAECRAATEGAELGYFLGPGETCGSGYTSIDLHQDLQVSYECSGCSCINPTSLLCDAGVIAHRPGAACPGFDTTGVLMMTYNDRCGPLPNSLNLHYYSIRGTAQCTATGTPTLGPAAWGLSMSFCMLDTVGGGCGPSEACLPAETGPLCALTEDDAECSGSFEIDHGTWYAGLEDDRACIECQCGLGTADCSGAYIAGYADGACGGAATPLGNGAQGDACGLPAPLATGRIIGTPTNASCQPNSFVTGDATPTGGRKACCQP